MSPIEVYQRDVLLRLIQMALGWEKESTLPLDVNWNDVVRIAELQDVLPIMIDGYESYLKTNLGAVSFLSIKENEDTKTKVLSALYVNENNYLLHNHVLEELSHIFAKDTIPFVVMKGLSCGKYYPKPNHRSFGDIDIYVGDSFERSNKSLKNAGIAVEPHYYRHSVALIKGVSIENHRVLCDLRGPKKQTLEFESLLESLAKNSIEEGESYGPNKPNAHYPSANFNALFLPWHVSAHFEFERVTLRHLLDWALFLYHEGTNIDIDLFRRAKKYFTYGFGPFADILTDLSIRYLKMPIDTIPRELVNDAYSINRDLSDKVFERMFEVTIPASDSNVWRERWKLFKYVLRDGWKYRGLYGMSPLKFLIYKCYGVIFKVGEE